MNKQRQYIYIDDSGDPGFKLGGGSSKIFVLAGVIFDNWDDVVKTKRILTDFKESIGWKEEREFKFHRTNDKLKKNFFECIKDCSFKIRAIVIDKTKTFKQISRKSKSFYTFIIEELLCNLDDLDEAYVFLDGSGDRGFRRKITSDIRHVVNRKGYKIAGFRLVDSNNNIIIQLADMIAGAIGAKYDKTKRFSLNTLTIIKDKIDNIWVA